MRLKAKEYLTYLGREWQPGALFDARERDGRELINQGRAEPFNLEDPSQRKPEDILENLQPDEPLPDVPGVSLTPIGVIVPGIGGTGDIEVTITSPGTSGTWIVDKDSTADWLTYTPVEPQSTDGTATWTAEANSGPARTANLYINGKTFKVDQNLGLSGKSTRKTSA